MNHNRDYISTTLPFGVAAFAAARVEDSSSPPPRFRADGKAHHPPVGNGSSPSLKDFCRLLRVHHYIKNGLIFVPLFFSLKFQQIGEQYEQIFISLLGFICFSLLSSVVYIINDIRDKEKDRLHSTKCRRPIPSGRISIPTAIATIGALLLLLSGILSYLAHLEKNTADTLLSVGVLALYGVLNLGYSFGLKNIPIVDITILASGFVLRVLFGALVIDVSISIWLYLTITLGAFYLGLGKRRNEIIKKETGTRAVMRLYSHNFLDKNMYMCKALCIVFYALWSIDPVTVQKFHTSAFAYTIPLILIILLKYSLNIEADSDGDPTNVLLHDKVLLALIALYGVVSFAILYQGGLA